VIASCDGCDCSRVNLLNHTVPDIEADSQRTNLPTCESVHSHAMSPNNSRALVGIAWALFFSLCLPAFGNTDMVLVRASSHDGPEDLAIRQVADFYGLTLDVVDVESGSSRVRAITALRDVSASAILISSDALIKLNQVQVNRALKRRNGAHIPILIFGIKSSTRTGYLGFWSHRAVQGCGGMSSNYVPKSIYLQRLGVLTGAVSGLQLPAVSSPECSLRFNEQSVQTVVSTSDDQDANRPVVLLRQQTAEGEVFFAPAMKLIDAQWRSRSDALPRSFSSLAPYILFISYAAGIRAWHSDGHYANLTIDDPWLIEPYGHLDYTQLLAEMEKHNFHTTIAFIPWNFDRSESYLVTLFKEHPKQYSISIHGNNHAHQEFGDYGRNPLPQQVADVKQAIARMERFRSITGIPYDRFMVFPHAVAPEPTFKILAEYGFTGTANSVNVPMHAKAPGNLILLFRPDISVYGGLLSLVRYSATGDLPRSQIAIQSFLGNPALFYGHENLFSAGPDAFNRFADFINQIEPDVTWANLGAIARHSHLIRSRVDGGYDVRMFSNEMDLKNPDTETQEFFVQKVDQFGTGLLTVNGRSAAFARTGEASEFRVSLPANQICNVRFTYKNDLDLAQQDIRKSSVYAYLLRTASDYRDLRLSKSALGSALIQGYYAHRWDVLELYAEKAWWIITIVALVIAVGIRWRREKRRQPFAKGTDVSGQLSREHK
jgi:hypothetical protein